MIKLISYNISLIFFSLIKIFLKTYLSKPSLDKIFFTKYHAQLRELDGLKLKIYDFQKHQIPTSKIDTHAFYIIEKLKQKGFEAYLVGGSVRDLLLKQVPKDFDVSTSAKPQDIKKIFKNCILIGKRFRLAHIKFGKKTIEVSTFRAGDVQKASLIKEHNIWGSAKQDAKRRDFTINALFYNPQNQTIIDYVNGFQDAKKKLLKTIGNPKTRFKQDPVRMLRLLKFKARFDFDIEKKTLSAMQKCKKEILKSSQARILEEILRMLQSGSSKEFFYLLEKHGFLLYLFPSLSSFLKKDQKTYNLLHALDIFICKHGIFSLEREILLSAILFPFLKNHLKEKYKQYPHLGLIAKEIKEHLFSFFSPFFHISRKMKIKMMSILLHQFRFLSKKLKIPKDPYFYLAIKFFKLRTISQKNLLQKYTLWHEHFIKSHKTFKI